MKGSRHRCRGVSNTVGIVLLVGIVVLLAATTWLLAAGLTDSLGPNPPQASFRFEYETSVTDPSCDTNPCEVVRISHVGGDTFDPERVEVIVDYVDSGTEKRISATWDEIEPGAVTASKDVRVWTNDPIDTLATAQITLVWTSPDGQYSDVITRWSGPQES